MKKVCVLIIAFIIYSRAGNAQPRLATETGTQNNIYNRFISRFAPDYALFNHLGAGLVRKGDQWSLVRTWDGQTLGGGKVKKKMHLLEHSISDTLAREILADAAPDNTFAIKQERLDKLPNVCKGDPQKQAGIAGRISDAETLMISEFSLTTRRKVQFYAADLYYNTCYPYHQEFKILEPMLNTFSTLEKYVNSYVGIKAVKHNERKILDTLVQLKVKYDKAAYIEQKKDANLNSGESRKKYLAYIQLIKKDPLRTKLLTYIDHSLRSDEDHLKQTYQYYSYIDKSLPFDRSKIITNYDYYKIVRHYLFEQDLDSLPELKDITIIEVKQSKIPARDDIRGIHDR